MVIPSASIRATSFSPSGDDRGFVLDEMLCAVISRSANHPSSATCSVDTRLPPDLIISASRRIASDPLTRSMRIDAVRVRRAQRIDHLDGVGVVDFFGTEVARFVDVAANGRDNVRATRVRTV